MEFEYAPIQLEGAKLVISCSNKSAVWAILNIMKEEVSAKRLWQSCSR